MQSASISTNLDAFGSLLVDVSLAGPGDRHKAQREFYKPAVVNSVELLSKALEQQKALRIGTDNVVSLDQLESVLQISALAHVVQKNSPKVMAYTCATAFQNQISVKSGHLTEEHAKEWLDCWRVYFSYGNDGGIWLPIELRPCPLSLMIRNDATFPYDIVP